jgi:hypothetical protein
MPRPWPSIPTPTTPQRRQSFLGNVLRSGHSFRFNEQYAKLFAVDTITGRPSARRLCRSARLSRGLEAGMLVQVVEASGRPGYEQVPRRLREWVERELGSPVASATNQPGGFSPGVAARLVAADGARAFVKAIATSRHAATAGLHRYERHSGNAAQPHSWIGYNAARDGSRGSVLPGRDGACGVASGGAKYPLERPP